MPAFWTDPVAKEWRNKVTTTDKSWEPTDEERPKGEAQGFFVRSGTLRAFLKPSRCDPPYTKCPRAAHEKIASDLAHDLSLPIPPVLLIDGKACGGNESAAALSLVMFPEFHKWSSVMDHPRASPIAHSVLRSSSTDWSGILAFDTWVTNTDRSNENNLLLGTSADVNQDSTRPFFCDYAFSMIQATWPEGSWKTIAAPPFLPVLTQFVDTTALSNAIERIATLTDANIQTIVARIPSTHLSDEHKALIIEGLCFRKTKLKDAFPQIS
jgi:hypothetical protein